MIHTISLPQLGLQSLTLNFDVALLSPASLEQQKAFGRLCQDPGAATRCSSLLLGLQHPFCQASFPVPLPFLHHQNSLGCTHGVPASSCHPHGDVGGILRGLAQEKPHVGFVPWSWRHLALMVLTLSLNQCFVMGVTQHI